MWYVPLSALSGNRLFILPFRSRRGTAAITAHTPAKLGSFSTTISDVRMRASVVSLEIAPLKGRKRPACALIAVCRWIIDAISRGLDSQPPSRPSSSANSAYHALTSCGAPNGSPVADREYRNRLDIYRRLRFAQRFPAPRRMLSGAASSCYCRPAVVAVSRPTGNSSYYASTHGCFINDDTRNFAVESIENVRRLISKYHRVIVQNFYSENYEESQLS